ncbi:MAG: hypothetical protein IT385_30395 [Deltaproteobacteria bacterium]|nr:hypothetical protein [Deltaproteobacteria bacterium]
MNLVAVVSCLWAAAACGTTPRHGFVIPKPGAEQREALVDGPITIERLVQRAQAELDAAGARGGAGGAAEVWVRRALQRDPDHPGALAVLARLHVAGGQRARARVPYALAAKRAPDLRGEQLGNLVALARDELDAGRAGLAAELLDEVERDLPAIARQDGAGARLFREEREALHRRLALTWLERGLREPARAAVEAAARLGRGSERAALQLEALDRGALQRARAEDVMQGQAEWLELARWLARFGRPEDVDWALASAREEEPEGAERARLEGLAAEVALSRDRPAEARERWVIAARAVTPDEASALLVRAAELMKGDGFVEDGLALLEEAAARTPGDARVARTRVRWAQAAKDPARVKAVALAFVAVRPEAWEPAFDWVFGPASRGDRLTDVADAILEAARAAGQDVPPGRAAGTAGEALARRPIAQARAAAESALGPSPRGITEAFVDQRAARAVRAWAALGPEPDRRELCAAFHRLVGARAMPEARLAILEAWHAAPEEGGEEPPWSALPDALLRLKRYAEAEAAANAALARTAATGVVAGAGPSAELVGDRFRAEERWDEALRFYDRLHVAEIQAPSTLAELARRLAMRGDELRAEEARRRFLDLARIKEIQPAAVIALAEQSAAAFAAQAFAIAVDAGDRTPRAFVGWMRALLRLGDDDGAERVANRFLGDRPRRDARAVDEVAKAFADEGRVARAAELVLGRLGEGERLDPNALAPLGEMLRRAGRGAELAALVARVVALEARNPQRAYQTGAQRLVEAGLVREADELVRNGLEARPRDPTLLSSALSLAVLRRDAVKSEALAGRLFAATPPGSAVDVMERVIGDVRAAAMPEVALALADDALSRLPGTPRLFIARGRVHLFAGRRELAVQDFADAVARGGFATSSALGAAGAPAVGPRAMLAPLEALLEAARLGPELVLVEARAMAQVPGRADVVVPYGRALLQAGRVEEAEQVFARFLADNDRGHATVAQVWFEAGRWRKALEHWSRGLDQVADADAGAVLGDVATSLAAIGEPERLDTFVRLFVQRLDARQRGLLQIARAHATVGRAEDALMWLGRAEEASPTAEHAWELALAHLDRGDDEAAVAAFERSIARRAADALPTQSTAWFGGAASYPVVNILVDQGRAGLARSLVGRVEARYGASAWSRLLAARAALADGDLGAVLDHLAAPLPPWRTNRDLLPLVRLLLDDLLAAGHGQAAMGLVERALEAGAEKELLIGSVRVAARAGHPEVALAVAERFAREHPVAQSWLAAETLVAEGLTTPGREALEQALTVSGIGPQLRRAALALHTTGEDAAAVMARARALGGDRVERALVQAHLHRYGGPALAPDNAARANDAIRPLLDQAFPDATVGLEAMIDGALADERGGSRLATTLRTLFEQAADRAKWARTAAAELGARGLPGAALDALELVAEGEAGDGGLALDAVELALAAGRPERAAAWRERMPAGAAAELARRLRQLERPADLSGLAGAEAVSLEDARRFTEDARAWLESSPEPERDRRRCAELALARVGVEAGWAAAGRSCVDAWIEEGGVDRATLELGLALAWHDRDLALAGKRADELARRYPGAVASPVMLLEAALASGDGAGLARLLARTAIADKDEPRLLRQALAASLQLGVTPAPAVLEVLAATVRAAPAADPDAAELAALVERLAAGPAAGVAAAEAAHRRSPRSVALTIVLADALVNAPRPEHRAEAEALLLAASRRPGQSAIFELDPRSVVGRQRGQLLAALGRVMSARGEHARAAGLLREAITLHDVGDVAQIGPLLVARGDALRDAGRADEAIASWTDALRRGSHQGWARAARQRLHQALAR